jgi:uncharacterized membrane protein YeiH
MPATAATQLLLEHIGVFAFAALGAQVALRRNLNILALIGAGELSAQGGGMIRDLALGAPPIALHRLDYAATALVAALLVAGLPYGLPRAIPLLRFGEAVGLSVFCISGTARAMVYGHGPVLAAVFGITTVLGGGVIRDLLTGHPPILLTARSAAELSPAVVVAVGTALAATLISCGVSGLAATAAATSITFLLLMICLWRHHRPKGSAEATTAVPNPRRPERPDATATPSRPETSRHGADVLPGEEVVAVAGDELTDAHRRTHRGCCSKTPEFS